MVTTYVIRRRDGQQVALHVRLDLPDGGKELAWFRPDGSIGLNGTPTKELPLYGVHLLHTVDPTGTVVVTEGEKAADSLRARGVPAVGTVCGAASTPSESVLADLAGRHVVLWPDNDDPGREHMERVGGGLEGVAATLRWADWPDAPEKGDAADYSGDPWDIVDAAELWVPPGTPVRGRDYEYLADIVVPDGEAPMALEPWLLGEGPAILFGEGGAGKSILAQAIASVVGTGRDDIIDGHTPTTIGPVVWADWEASRLRLARRQLLIGPAPIIRVNCVKPVWHEAELLRRIVEREGAIAVVIDSVIPAISGGNRSSKDAEPAGQFFNAVNAIAPRSLSIAHVTKDAGRDADKPFGSAFFHNLARLTWSIRQEERDSAHVVTLLNHKRNDGDRYRPRSVQIDWTPPLRISPASLHLSPERVADIVAMLGDGEAVSRKAIEAQLAADSQVVGASFLTELLARAVTAGLLTRPRKGWYATTTGNPTGNPGLGLSDEDRQ